MSENRDLIEAQRRVDAACRTIQSAYRLHSLDPKDTIDRVRASIAMGAEDQANDISEAAFRAA